MATYEIHPRIGVARLGNSPTDFYLAPNRTGGLPVACDANGDETSPGAPVTTFKDEIGRIMRQASKFKVYRRGEGVPTPVIATSDDVKSVTWTVHVANKKPIWYTFSELQGDLNFGDANSYANQHIPVNNPDVTSDSDRKELMIDPGPRTVSGTHQSEAISRYNIPEDYANGSFPKPGQGGQQIDSLGELRTDADGNLVFLPGFGKVTGSSDISSFRGASGYWDDICDGYVLATIELMDGSTVTAEPAWILVGSPKYAPELVNITTLYDTAFDVAVREKMAQPEMYDSCAYGTGQDSFPLYDGYTPLSGYNPDLHVNFQRDIKPIFDRMAGYQWVADIPYLANFARIDWTLLNSAAGADERKKLFALFRVPIKPEDYAANISVVQNGPSALFSSNGLPLLPLNSGDNSVTNEGPVYKFETLSVTQFYCMNQWAEGKFTQDPPPPVSEADAQTEAHMGNCVGAPFSPGIETTWIVRRAKIYEKALQLKTAHFDSGQSDPNGALTAYYNANGLSTTADEAEGNGCEPGDLTKRMAIPWQADFAECTVQTPNITVFDVNQFDATGIEVPPAYYVYWWPPQSPMHVTTGSVNAQEQVLDAIVSQIAGQTIVPAGQRVNFQRGILNVTDIIGYWGDLGFIVNQGSEIVPYFVEQERNFGTFGQLASRQISAQISAVQPK